MVRRLGRVERILRVVLGVALLGLYGALPAPWRYLTLVGLLPFGTGLLGRCPVSGARGAPTSGVRPT